MKYKLWLLFLLFFLISSAQSQTRTGEYKKLLGKWMRTDGSYTLRVRNVKPDGTVEAGYFNPREIHIAEAGVSEWKGLLKLFVKLQDEGYPGSTYTLYYYAEKDALVGFYYHAAMKQTFEVVFIRK
jgi:hypothetical protein